MTELEFRNKVTWFSFALSLLVIWVHSYNAELFLGYQAATGMVYVLVRADCGAGLFHDLRLPVLPGF